MPERVGCRWCCRLVPVPFHDDTSRRVFAVSGDSPPHPVLVYDVTSKQQISHCMGHRGSTYGLASLPSTVSSNPKIVSGSGSGDCLVFVFDAIEGKRLCQLPEAPKYTFNILGVPEWNENHHHVFVAGGCDREGCIYRYDLATERKIGSYVGHASAIPGLGACIAHNLVVSASEDKTVRLWSRDDYSCQTVVDVKHRAYSCSFVEERSTVLVGLECGKIDVYDIRRFSSDEKVGTVNLVARSELVNDIAQVDEDRFVCGCGLNQDLPEVEGDVLAKRGSLYVFSSSTYQVLAKAIDLEGDVFGVCAFGLSSRIKKDDLRERLGFAEEFMNYSCTEVRFRGRLSLRSFTWLFLC